MKKIIVFVSLALLCLISMVAEAATPNLKVPQGDCGYTTEFVEYKQVDTIKLNLFVATPDNIAEGENRPAVIFMHGGGWNSGSYDSFENHCRYLATKGIVAISIDYRLGKLHKASPKQALCDAKSAVRYVRANAEKFHIDPDRIITSGGSAGGHLAAAVSMCPKINDPSDDVSISSASAAVILFNPVVCNGPDTLGSYKGYGYSRVKRYYEDFSPIHNVKEGVPPTIFMVGDKDHLIPVEMAQEYKRLLEQVGSRCDLHIFAGQKHGFYHFGRKPELKRTNFFKSMTLAHEFLVSLGYLEGPATVGEWLDVNNYKY